MVQLSQTHPLANTSNSIDLARTVFPPTPQGHGAEDSSDIDRGQVGHGGGGIRGEFQTPHHGRCARLGLGGSCDL